jgi:endoglucanase
VAGQIYTGSAWAEAATSGRTVQAVLGFLSGTGQVLDTAWAQGTSETTTGWTQTVPAVGVAPAGTAYVELVVLIYGTAQGETHYLDTASLTTTPSGSRAIVGPLHTSGNQIYDANNNPVVFRGLNRWGLQSDTTPNLTSDDINHAKQWGANFVRVPLGEQFWLSNSCTYDSTYASKVDNMVNWITSRGMVAFLDLHYNTVSPCGPAGQQDMADAPNSINFWQQVAARYKSNPLVAFDLYNEPHDISSSVWLNGGQVTQGSVTFQAAGMQQMYSAVRGQGATNLVFASGNNWGNTFSGILSGYNIVYAVHAYTCPGAAPPNCSNPNPYDPSPILNGWVSPSQYVPVMVTEFGWPNKNDGQYITNVISYAQSHGWGWDVFAWDGATSGLFDLLGDVGPGAAYEPSPSGMPVITGFSANR